MKVYVIEMGAYSDRYIDAIFTSRELAQQYQLERMRNNWTGPGEFPEPTEAIFDDPRLFAKMERRRAEYYWAQWAKEPTDPRRWLKTPWDAWTYLMDDSMGSQVGSIDEYELWDAVPVAPAESSRS